MGVLDTPEPSVHPVQSLTLLLETLTDISEFATDVSKLATDISQLGGVTALGLGDLA